MRLIIETNTNKRCVNFFTNNKIAMIIFYKLKKNCERDIVVTICQNKSKNMQMYCINQNHKIYILLHYIFLFSRDEYNYYYKMQLLQNSQI